MRLKEHDLVLRGSRGVDGLALEREVIVHLTRSQIGRGLGDEFCSHHGLAIPVRGRVNGKLETLVLPSDGGVLVGSAGVEIGRCWTATVNVPLVGADLVGPCPFVKVGRRREWCKGTVPDDSSSVCNGEPSECGSGNERLHHGKSEGTEMELYRVARAGSRSL